MGTHLEHATKEWQADYDEPRKIIHHNTSHHSMVSWRSHTHSIFAHPQGDTERRKSVALWLVTRKSGRHAFNQPISSPLHC
jgi:hypothetical protein